jgi:hypothetical protein
MNYDKVIFDYASKNKNGIQILAYRPLTNHPGDSFLFKTLCYWPKDRKFDPHEWVVWNFNAQTKSYFQGRYFLEKNRAYADFLKQGNIDVEYFEKAIAIELSPIEFKVDDNDQSTFEVSNNHNMYSIYVRMENDDAQCITDHREYMCAVQMGLYIANRYFLPFHNHVKHLITESIK